MAHFCCERCYLDSIKYHVVVDGCLNRNPIPAKGYRMEAAQQAEAHTFLLQGVDNSECKEDCIAGNLKL